MRKRRLLALALLVVACGGEERAPAEERSARRVNPAAAASRFDPKQSTGFFVGIDTFTTDVAPVFYAVNDAIDLAHAFAFEKKIQLIPPERIVLLLQGDPTKPESRKRLDALLAAGAKRHEATQESIPLLLAQQARAAGAHGLLVAGFATHGFSSDGTPYVLGSDSELHKPASALSVPRLLEIAGMSRRSVIFIDACRNRDDTDTRGASNVDPRVTAPDLDRLKQVQGQAVFYAAAPGNVAHVDHTKMNGVFTSAILECIRCDVQREGRGVVTAAALSRYVETNVLKWLRENVDPSAQVATQWSDEGESDRLRIASCPPPVPLVRREVAGSRVTAYDAHDKPLFTHDLGRPISHAEVVDLEADGTNEVVVSTDNRVVAFAYDGTEAWSAPTDMPVRTFLTGDFFTGKNRQVVTLSVDARNRKSRITLWDNEGVALWSYPYAGELQHLAIDRPTSHHGWKIVATAINPNAPRATHASVMVITRANVREWIASFSGRTVRKLEVRDIDNDTRRDIVVTTDEGRICFDFDSSIKNVKNTQMGLLDLNP